MNEYLVIDKHSMKVQSVITVSAVLSDTDDVFFIEKPQDLNIQFSHNDYFFEDGQIIEKPKE